MSRLIPQAGRRAFYLGLTSDDGNSLFTAPPNLPFDECGSKFLHLEKVYSGHAMALLDLGKSAKQIQTLFARATLAGQRWLETPYRPLPFHALKVFFDVQVAGDERALEHIAHVYLARVDAPTKKKPVDPHLEALCRALACDVLEDREGAKAALAAGALLPPSSRQPSSHVAWFQALLALAKTCLLDPPRRALAPYLQEVDLRTKRYFRQHEIDEDRIYEPYVNRFALAFVGRAQRRGFEIAQVTLPSSMPVGLLKLPARALPNCGWRTWPTFHQSHWRLLQRTYELEATAVAQAVPAPRRRSR